MPLRSGARIPGMETKRTEEDVANYIASLESERRRDESKKIVAMMEEIAAESASLCEKPILKNGGSHGKEEKSIVNNK